jgi:glycosyltransferase involved in cell wall biosynthesis
MAPRFTFCIPNLNKIEFLPACIDSMLAQDCDDWCCVFVDGFSTDGSWEYMQQFADDERFKLLRGEKQGMYTDWNVCLQNVNTEYFYFLTSDDTCYPTLVSTTTKALDVYKDIDAIHFLFEFIDKNGFVTKKPEEIVSQHYPTYVQYMHHTHRRKGSFEFIMHCAYKAIYTTITSLVFRSTIISEMKRFSTQYGSAGDLDWTMRLCFHTDILFIPSTLATWRIYEEQATQNTNALASVEAALKITSENAQEWMRLQKKSCIKNNIRKYDLTYMLTQHYISKLYLENFILNPSILRALKTWSTFPLYPFRKLIHKLSLGYALRYKKEYEIAEYLIQKSNVPKPELLNLK